MAIYKRTWTRKDGSTGTAWRVQTRSPSGELIQRQFDTQREAREFDRNGVAQDAETGSRATIGETAKQWLATAKSGDGAAPLEAATVQMYAGFVRNHIEPDLGLVPWRKLTIDRVEEWRDGLLAKGLSRSTAKRVLNTLAQLTRYAVRRRLVSHSVVADVDIKEARGRHIDRSSKSLSIHTKAEVKAILAKADELAASTNKRTAQTWKRYRVILNVLFHTGLRSSELRGLPRDAVAPDGSMIEVRQRADKDGVIGKPKSAAGYRKIPLPDHVAAMLREWIADERKREREAKKVEGEFVFSSANGTPLLHANLRKDMWTTVQAKAEVTQRRFHDIRHYYASRLIEEGCKPLNLTRLMGHSTAAFTLSTYGHLFADDALTAEERRLAEAVAVVTDDDE